MDYSNGNGTKNHSSGRRAKPLPFHKTCSISPPTDEGDFVEGLLVLGALSVVFGKPEAGKTFWALDLAMHVASGMQWNGREIDSGGVLYLALEGGSGIDKRICAWNRRHGMEGVELPAAIVKMPLILWSSEGHCEEVIETARQVMREMGREVRLIVVDTLARALAGGNESASEDMGGLITVADTIRAATGAHLMFIHHPGKDSSRGARGWSGLLGAVDTEIEVISDDSGRRAVVTKQKDLQGGGVFPFMLDEVILGTNRRGKPITSCVAMPVSSESTAAKNPARRLTGASQCAHLALQFVISSDEAVSGYSCLPPKVRAVTEAQWRQAFYGRYPGDTSKAKRSAFVRAVKELLYAGAGRPIAAMNNGYVWLTEAPHDPPHDPPHGAP